MFEIESDIAGRMEARLGIFLQAMLHDSFECRRDITIGFAEVGRIFLQDGAHRVGSGVAMECSLAREHLVENRTEAEDVGAWVHGNATNLLGRHVTGGAHHSARFGGMGQGRQRGVRAAFGLSQFGESEIEDLDAAIFGDEKIFRLQIAMNNSFFVGRGQSMRDLQGVIQGLAHRDRSATQPLAKSFSLEQFRYDVGRSLVSSDIEYRKNIGMVQGGGGQRLLFKTAQAIGVQRERLRQDFDGYFAFKARVTGAIDLAHATRA